MNKINKPTDTTLAEIKRMFSDTKSVAFPYNGCRKLLQIDPIRYEGLIPELDFYFSKIAGYCSWGDEILNWSPTQINTAASFLRESFFEKHILFEPLQSLVTINDTPDLYQKLAAYEMLRLELLGLMLKISAS